MEYLAPILIFIGMGILFGVLLVVLSKVFAVKVDQRAVEITEALPGANCGACGYAGCADYADAIVNKGAPMNACLPGGANAASAIGEIMGVSVDAAERMVPVLHCNGTCNATKKKFDYDGIQSCTAAKRFYGGNGVCAYGCLGLGDCMNVCENNGISIQNGIAVFCTENCVSCNKCARVCPNGLIELRSEKKRVDMKCSSRNTGKAAMLSCENACIGCRKCEKICKFNAIHIENAYAVIDYDKCKSCGLCAKECPRDCIHVEPKRK
jgi:Na+-translocating ferredoxin:NAD+ oxidoreductase RNF subunit RnfB